MGPQDNYPIGKGGGLLPAGLAKSSEPSSCSHLCDLAMKGSVFWSALLWHWYPRFQKWATKNHSTSQQSPLFFFAEDNLQLMEESEKWLGEIDGYWNLLGEAESQVCFYYYYDYYDCYVYSYYYYCYYYHHIRCHDCHDVFHKIQNTHLALKTSWRFVSIVSTLSSLKPLLEKLKKLVGLKTVKEAMAFSQPAKSCELVGRHVEGVLTESTCITSF